MIIQYTVIVHHQRYNTVLFSIWSGRPLLGFGCFRLIGFKACTFVLPLWSIRHNQFMYLWTILCPCYFVAFVIFIYTDFYCWSFWTLVILWWVEVPLIGSPPLTFCGNYVVYVLESLQWLIRNWCLLWPIWLSYSNISSDQNKYCLVRRETYAYLILQHTFFASEKLWSARENRVRLVISSYANPNSIQLIVSTYGHDKICNFKKLPKASQEDENGLFRPTSNTLYSPSLTWIVCRTLLSYS